MAEQFISCPSCGKKIQLTEAFTHEIEQKLRTEFDSATKKLERDHAAELRAKEKELEEKHARDKTLLEKQARKQAEQSVAVDLQDLNTRLEEKTKEVDQAQKRELNLRKQIRDVETREKNLEFEVQRKVDAEKKTIWEEATKTASEQHRFKDAEKDKRMEEIRMNERY